MDKIDKIQAQWSKQRPDLDTEPMATIGRLMRISNHLAQEMSATFAKYSLTGAGFDVLATLLRSGPPHALTPNQLLETMMVTSGTMTNRIDQLEKDGLVKRVQNSNDKRSVSIALTQKGKKLIDVAVIAHVETQKQLVSTYSDSEQAALNGLLKIYLKRLEE